MWNTLIIDPITWLLHFLYNISGSLAIAIILLTIIIRLILVPLQISANRTGKNMKKIQPELDSIKNKHKSDPKAMMREMNKLYKENKIKPFSSLLGLIIQIPIVIGLYLILVNQLKNTESYNVVFLGINIINPSYFLSFLTFITMFILMKISVQDMSVSESASQTQKDFIRIMKIQMLYFLPVVTFLFTIFLPAGLAIYFVVGNIFLIFQNLLFRKYLH